MQTQIVVVLILTVSAQGKRDERPRLEPPPVRRFPAVNIIIGGENRELTLEMPAAAPAGEDDDQPAEAPAMRMNFRTAMLDRDNFDRWLFAHELSEPAQQRHLTQILDATIDLATVEHKLTDSQRAKLRLAGRGDIKRFFDGVQHRRDAFEIARKDFQTGLWALRRLDEVAKSYRDGPFGAGSLFAKTLHKIDNDQKQGF